MKKFVKRSLLIALLVLIFLPSGAKASEDVRLWINGSIVESDVSPFIEEGRTLVPIRIISETLGYEVSWNNDERSVVVGDKLKLFIDNKKVLVNGEEREIDVPPTLKDSRTFVPLRFIAEAFDLKVDWDNDNYTAIVGEGYIKPEPVVKPIEETKTNSGNSNTKVFQGIEEYYIGNKNSRALHRPSCPSVYKMKDYNKVKIDTREEAIERGFKPCGNCHP